MPQGTETGLLREVEQFLRASGMPSSRFSREAAGDSRFVFDLRRGRIPRLRKAARVRRFIANWGND